MKAKLIIAVLAILLAIGIALTLINNSADKTDKKPDSKTQIADTKASQDNPQAKRLPMLVDLGKGTCIPCKKMKPILEELEAEYKGRAIVRVIDLRYEPKEASKYKIRLIPTQIFFDAEGNEVFRHEGFMDKQSIKTKFAEMGVY